MSYGQSLLKEFLQLAVAYPFLEDYRPDWLHGMELDFYFPDLKFGVEFQGDQHFMDTETFGSCCSQRERDGRKRMICKQNGVILQQFTAFDLQATRVRSKLKWVFRCLERKRCFRGGWFKIPHKPQLRELSQRAIAYRKQLINSFDSPTARRRGRSRAKAFSRHGVSSRCYHV